MKCLIDADVLVYELAFCGQSVDEETEELVVRGFEFVAELLDQRIKEIVEECWAESCTLYLTNDKKLQRMLERRAKTLGESVEPYVPNFREHIAVSKPYKGTRAQEKPFHRDNIRAYILEHYDCIVANGMEADDLMAIHQTDSTTICTRDKDLRMVEGMQFGWPCGKQPQFGPLKVEGVGSIELVNRKEIKGYGPKFFYSQLITGDKVDNIPGLPRGGAVMAYDMLADLETEEEMLEAVKAKYEEKLGEGWDTYLLEQGRLLWMVRELDDEGKPVMWEIG